MTPTSSRLLDSFEHRVSEIAAEIVPPVLEKLQVSPASQHPAIASHLGEQCRQHVQLIGQWALTGRPPSSRQLEFARREGMSRAAQSPLCDLLHAYRVPVAAIREWIGRKATANYREIPSALLLTEHCSNYLNMVPAALSVGYMQERQRLGLGFPDHAAPPDHAAHTALGALEHEVVHRLLTGDFEVDTRASVASSSGESGQTFVVAANGLSSAQRLVRLSPRERDVVQLLTRGLSNKEIAYQLRISVETTKEYMSHILEKTGLSSRAGVAAAYASRPALPLKR